MADQMSGFRLGEGELDRTARRAATSDNPGAPVSRHGRCCVRLRSCLIAEIPFRSTFERTSSLEHFHPISHFDGRRDWSAFVLPWRPGGPRRGPR
jgi:hypothetical protein